MRVVVRISARIIHAASDIGIAADIHILVKAGRPGEGKAAGAGHFSLLGGREVQAFPCAAECHIPF